MAAEPPLHTHLNVHFGFASTSKDSFFLNMVKLITHHSSLNTCLVWFHVMDLHNDWDGSDGSS